MLECSLRLWMEGVKWPVISNREHCVRRRKVSTFIKYALWRKCVSSLLRGMGRLYLDISEQISQGHFLLAAAPTLNQETIPLGVFLSCDLPRDTLHTHTLRQSWQTMHSPLWGMCGSITRDPGTCRQRHHIFHHGVIKQLRTISSCLKAATKTPTNHTEVKKVLPPRRWSDSLASPESSSLRQFHNITTVLHQHKNAFRHVGPVCGRWEWLERKPGMVTYPHLINQWKKQPEKLSRHISRLYFR